MKSLRRLEAVAVFPLLLLLLQGCGVEDRESALGSPRLRGALFDTIIARTERREAFSPLKNAALDFDPLESMGALREAVVDADSEEDLFYALLRLSNARRDRHLQVALVPQGLALRDEAGLPAWGREIPPDPWEAPVRILPDYGPGEGSYFVADVALGVALLEGELAAGDRIASVNGVPMAEFEAEAMPYVRHSTLAGFRWKLAEAMTLNTAILPPDLRGETLELGVMGEDGSISRVSLPYVRPEDLVWPGWSEPFYPGFTESWSTPSFDLYLPDDGRPLVLLQWHGFEASLVADVDRLMDDAQAGDLLDRAVIVDATRSGGGSLGAYALQRLQPLPFKTTFGTLRISDVIEPFVERKREEFQALSVQDSGGPETIDDGTWLMDWLEHEVMDALAEGKEVTDPVPFKLAHAPKDSDGILRPAPLHFAGPLVVFSGPHGGSHLDQFVAIVADNQLGAIIGMPPGGYSNTWEWEEVLTYPGTDQPVVGFMWSIGHTIRPNGEVLEGNPASVTHPIPLTRENASLYYELLMEAALRYLASVGFEGEE